MNKYFPIFIDIEGKKVLFFGAGKIAARRLESLAEFGVNITVIAPKISEKVYEVARKYPNQIKLKKGEYIFGKINNVDFVFSATNDHRADEQIFCECKSKGIPVNIASDKAKCDFYFPALIQKDDIIIGVSSGGKDHRKVRNMSNIIRKTVAETGDVIDANSQNRNKSEQTGSDSGSNSTKLS